MTTVAEYSIVREGGAGLIDLSSRGRILVSGSESEKFLNGLITNDMKALAENSWMPAAFPNVQGRLLANVRVIRLGADYLIDTDAVTRERVLKTLERFTLAGDFRVTDLTKETAHLSLQGQRAAEIVRSLIGENEASLHARGAVRTNWQQNDLTLVRASHTGEEGFDFIVDSKQKESLSNALLDAGAQPVGDDALEVLRIEAGIPRYGIDMDENNVVTETNLDDAVSFTKGCYIGQEIIARIKYRGHVAKKLTGISFNEEAAVDEASVIKSTDDKEIGRITSATYSPRLKRTIALGYVKFDCLAHDTDVKVVSGNREFPAKVTDLPFVKHE